MKTSFLSALVLVLASPAWAAPLPPDESGASKQLVTSPRHGEWVTVTGAGTAAFDAWVVYPERPDPAPVIVLIHEIFGLTDWARAVADQYAAEGFLVIAPDFLSGKAPDGKAGSAALGPDASRGAIAKLDSAEILARLNASAEFATALPSAMKAYGVVGFCWGGGIAFSWATAQPGLRAAVGFYGTAPQKEALAAVRVPILALYGGSDARVTSTLAPFRDEMQRLGKPFESEVYDGAGHAFLRQQSGQNGSNQVASEKAWPRSVAFLKKSLEGPSAVSQASGAALETDDCPDCEVPVLLALAPSH